MDDLKAFEDFIDNQESLELCLNLYLTWMAVYGVSGFIEHFRAMTRAKAVLTEFKQSMAV